MGGASRIGYGIVGGLDVEVVRVIAAAVEQAGMHSLWVNHVPPGDALETMAAAADVTTRLRLASGVIPVDAVPAAEVVSTIRALELPTDRIVIGIGARRPPSPLSTVRGAAQEIRDSLGVPVVVGALGPRMVQVGMAEADGVLLNWLTPQAARATRRTQVSPQVEVALYVRGGIGAAARKRAAAEAERYAARPEYARHFARHGFAAIHSVVLADDPADLRAGLASYDGAVDETVLRAVTVNDDVDEHLELIQAASRPDGT